MTDEELTRSEIINEFGEELGEKLIDAGFSSKSSLLNVEDEVLIERGFEAVEITTIREALSVATAEMEIEVEEAEEVEEGDGLEEGTDEPEIEEADTEEADALPEEEPGEEESEEVDEGAGAEEAPVAAPEPQEPLPGPEASVRIQRIRAAQGYPQDAESPPSPIEPAEPVPPPEDLGSVGVDFVLEDE
jgi:hypothetical protein